jgi:phage terminase small subunit
MAALNNSKRERFCQLRLEGKTLEQAYAGAGYNPSKPAASRMAKMADIVQRMKELHVHALNRAEVTVESIAQQLDADRALAYKLKNPSAAVAASMGKAKLYGLITDRQAVQVTHNYAQMSEEELRFELAAIAAEARAIKPGVNH